MVNKQSVTIKQVAARAGVSMQTVSRVLNHRSDISEETRQRIQQIMDELGYKPSASARGLASKRTYTLGLVVDDFTNYWFGQVAKGAELEAYKKGYIFMMGSTICDPLSEPQFTRLLIERNVEGVLFVHAIHPGDLHLLQNVSKHGIPVVVVDNYATNAEFSIVDGDNIDGGKRATQHLIDLGHSQIAMITGPSDWNASTERSQGYYEALQFAGITADSRLIIRGQDWNYADGYAAMKELLKNKSSFTAVFAQSDLLARGAIRAVRESGLNVPEDISIIGFDDTPEAEYSDPPLTTIRQPTQEIGRAAVRMLIEEIESKPEHPAKMLFTSELVRRLSCARLRS